MATGSGFTLRLDKTKMNGRNRIQMMMNMTTTTTMMVIMKHYFLCVWSLKNLASGKNKGKNPQFTW